MQSLAETPIDYIYQLRSEDKKYRCHIESRNTIYLTYNLLDNEKCDQVADFGPLPVSNDETKFVILTVPHVSLEGEQCVGMYPIVHILNRFMRMKLKSK